MTTRVPPRPANVPPRAPQAQRPNPAVAAAAPPTPAAPVAPAAPPQPVAASPAPVAHVAPVQAPVTPAAPQPAQAPAAGGKRRGRKAGAAPRAPKPAYPGLFAWNADNTPIMVDDGTNTGKTIQQRVKLTTVPDDYNGNAYEKLRANDFEDEAVFWDFQAQLALQRAEACEKRAKEIRMYSAAGDKKAASKFLKMRSQIAALREALRAQGVSEDMLNLELGETPVAE